MIEKDSSRAIPTVRGEQSDWIYRDFLKDKIRARERYTRSIQHDETIKLLRCVEEQPGAPYYFVPDGVVWRKYLPLISHLVEKHAVKFIFLESAAELMDYRNSSPVLSDDEGGGASFQESSSGQERNKIQKLVLRGSSTVVPFCDLSIRDEDCDEFQFLNYKSMSVVDRSTHAILRAEGILKDHVSKRNSTVVLVVSEMDLIDRCRRSGDDVAAIHVNDFISFLVQNAVIEPDDESKISGLKMRCEQEYKQRNKSKMLRDGTPQYEEKHLSTDKVEEGLRDKSLLRGRLEVTKANPKEAYVNAGGEKYFVDGVRKHMNRSFHHDVVVVRPLPESEYGRPVGRRRLVHHRDDADDEDIAEANLTPAVPSARVVAIAVPSRRKFIATLVDSPMEDEAACIVVPMDIRIPKIRIRTKEWHRFLGKRLLVEVDEWEEGSNYPHGRCLEILGPIADLETEVSCLLHENEVNLDPFSAAAISSLPPEGPNWLIPQEEIEKRLDLRQTHRIFSVDPPGCQDIDDTMHCKVLPTGDIEVGVHIADVSYFVRHNTPLDIEAQVRGTTFYLVDRRYDMLPGILSSDLCSLHGNTDRLAVSAIWVFSSDFQQVKSTWFGRTVIHNVQAMTYDQAHNIIHGKPPDSPNKPLPPALTAGYPVEKKNVANLKHDLTILTKLARKLRKDREEIGGAVDLSSGDLGNELKFVLDKDNSPIRVTPKKDMEIHHTIAELMILANSSVATRIFEALPKHAVLRIHRSVEEDRFEDLKEVLDAGNIKFDGTSNMALANSLKEAEQSKSAGSSVNALFRSLATRAMSEAQYVCTGDEEVKRLSHYGLGLEKYTHFTSPIRRYADVIVHKQLLSVLKYASEQSNISPPMTTVRFKPSDIGSVVVPESKVISIYMGEGIESNASSLEQEATQEENDIQIEQDQQPSPANLATKSSMETDDGIIPLSSYNTARISALCEGLNLHNRLAKLSSVDCQSLFLSLYFKDHVEITQAVVTNLRQNGFWVFIPKFDMRSPVYVSDKEGNLQIDPELIGLSPSAGEQSTGGFSDRCRLFPMGSSQLISDADGERVVISLAGKSQELVIRTLDVVTVEITCDVWDVRARVPSPRVHLISHLAKKSASDRTKITSGLLKRETTDQRAKAVYFGSNEAKDDTVYKVLQELEIPTVLKGVPHRKHTDTKTANSSKESRKNDTFSTMMKGRICYGGFVNPDTKSATQEAALTAASEAAAQRRTQALANRSRSEEYDTVRRIEQTVTARSQKLVASKRNTRKSKAK